MDNKNTPPQNVPTTETPKFHIPMMDAKRMSFDNASGSPPFEYKASPPLSSFFTRSNITAGVSDDPLTSMASATRRDSLKGIHNLQDFSTD